MKLDFPTLYLVILLNSLTLTVIWGAIAYDYRNFLAARPWLGASVLTTVGGALLALQGDGFNFVLALVGNALVIFGFGLVWSGVRSFYGKRGGWGVPILVTLCSVVALSIVRDSPEARNVVYATGQIVPLLLAMFHLLFREGRSLGTAVAAGAMMVGILGQGTEAVLNLMRIAGALSTEGYYGVAAYCLLAIIFGAVVWNFGFVLLAIDRLRNELALLAVVDELTGVPNRRRFMENAAIEEARARRTGRAFSILLLDLDNFKAINDGHGHAAGDASLRYFADITSKHLPEEAMFARFGGDEFCVLLPETGTGDAGAVANDLVRIFRSGGFTWKGQPIPLTASIGVAEWSAVDKRGASGTIENADAALYETKRRGRNGYSVFRAAQAGAKAPVILSVLPSRQ